LTNVLGAVWAGFLAWILIASRSGASSPTEAELHVRELVVASLFFPAYYLAASWVISLKFWLRSWGCVRKSNEGR